MISEANKIGGKLFECGDHHLSNTNVSETFLRFNSLLFYETNSRKSLKIADNLRKVHIRK